MEKLFTRKEAAELLGISITTLDAARNNGLISYAGGVSKTKDLRSTIHYRPGESYCFPPAFT